MGLIFLTGMPGAGKTTIGRRLADKLRLPFVDLDAEIEAGCGKSIADIFREEGEPYFRELERECLRDLCASSDKIIALGGGTLMELESLARVHDRGVLIYLRADIDTLIGRVQGAARPLLSDALTVPQLRDRLSDLLAARSAHFESADVTIDVSPDDMSESCVIRIVEELANHERFSH